MNREKTLATAAAGMTDKTARKYGDLGKLPSQSEVIHDWKTREDAFEGDWPRAEELLKTNPGLEAKTLFEALQRDRPGQYQDVHLGYLAALEIDCAAAREIQSELMTSLTDY